MRAVLGISSKRNRLSLKINEQTYWCTHKSYENEPGDFLALYYTQYGIAQIYRIHDIINPGDKNENFSCSMRGMLTVKTILLETFNNPISAKQMKRDDVLMNMNAVGRNFQATSFRISPPFWNQIIKVLKENNPEARLDYF